VYRILLQVISSPETEAQQLKHFVKTQFIESLLELFNSELQDERDILKNILHKLYCKLVPRRKMIRQKMNDLFENVIHDNLKFNGISEILDI
jgi:serine/threonine-protein phosphatase 2A regulatory subunit B'